MKLGHVAELLGSNIRAARGATELAEREPLGYSIDSRTIRAGELFFAIQGEHHDGHLFVLDAIARRAIAAVVARGFLDSDAGRQIDPQKAALIIVDDTLSALQGLARDTLKTWQGEVVAITGSMGKTTTKDIAAAMLSSCARVIKTTGNLNNAYGLPLSVLQIESDGRRVSDFDFAVLEMGMNHKGEIARLTGIAPPDVGVVTVVAAAHLEFFNSVDEIAEAKSEMISGIVPGGLAVLNADDERVAGMASMRRDIAICTFGIESEADVMAREIEADGVKGSDFLLVTPRGQIAVHVALPGRHNIYNALAAAAVADHYATPLEKIASAMSDIPASRMRGEVLRFREGFTLIDDSYNSNPRALFEMVSTLAATYNGRKVVIAGEMLELGQTGPQLHREAGRQIAQLGIDMLLAVRGLANEIVAGAREGGMSSDAAVYVETPAEAAAILIREVRQGDSILVKGSRGVRTEIVVERMKREFEMLPGSEQAATDSRPDSETFRQLA